MIWDQKFNRIGRLKIQPMGMKKSVRSSAGKQAPSSSSVSLFSSKQHNKSCWSLPFSENYTFLQEKYVRWTASGPTGLGKEKKAVVPNTRNTQPKCTTALLRLSWFNWTMITWLALFTLGWHILQFLASRLNDRLDFNHEDMRKPLHLSLLRIFSPHDATSSVDLRVTSSTPWGEQKTEDDTIDECSPCTKRDPIKEVY